MSKKRADGVVVKWGKPDDGGARHQACAAVDGVEIEIGVLTQLGTRWLLRMQPRGREPNEEMAIHFWAENEEVAKDFAVALLEWHSDRLRWVSHYASGVAAERNEELARRDDALPMAERDAGVPIGYIKPGEGL